jgi:TonB family protein
MSVAAAWVLYCGVISLVMTAAALAWQGAARWSGRGTRWGWITALLASVTLPALLRLVPRHTWPEPVAATLPSIPVAPQVQPLWPVAMDPLYVTVVRPGSWGMTEYGVVAWVALSLVGLALLVYAMANIGAARRFWRAREVDGERVYVSASTGPAALGVWRCAVVVPQWALELRDDLRRLLLTHEREHVRAGDPRLLFLGLLCVAAMPWNPLVWYQVRRLRDALELDCDARVLAGGADPRAYGSLLLEMGRRGSNGTLLMATFAEPRTFLEDRIRQIAGWPGRRDRRRAVAWSLLGLLLFATAVSARDPLAVAQPLAAASAAPVTQPAVGTAPLPQPDVFPADTPVLVNRGDVEQWLVSSWPEALQHADRASVFMVLAFVDARGVVQRFQLGSASGEAQLQQVALNAVARMQFAGVTAATGGVWVEVPIVFGSVAALPDAPARDDVIRIAPVMVALPVTAARPAVPVLGAAEIAALFAEGRALDAIEAARAALARGEITAEQAETLSQRAAVAGFQLVQAGDPDVALSVLSAAMSIPAMERSQAMISFFTGFALMRQAHPLLSSQPTAASAQRALALLERARHNLEYSAAYTEQDATRRQLISQVEQLTQVANAIIRSGR